MKAVKFLNHWFCNWFWHSWKLRQGYVQRKYSVWHYEECKRCGWRRARRLNNSHQAKDHEWLGYRDVA